MLGAVVRGWPGYWEGVEIVFVMQKADFWKKAILALPGKVSSGFGGEWYKGANAEAVGELPCNSDHGAISFNCTVRSYMFNV